MVRALLTPSVWSCKSKVVFYVTRPLCIAAATTASTTAARGAGILFGEAAAFLDRRPRTPKLAGSAAQAQQQPAGHREQAKGRGEAPSGPAADLADTYRGGSAAAVAPEPASRPMGLFIDETCFEMFVLVAEVGARESACDREGGKGSGARSGCGRSAISKPAARRV